MENIFLGKIQTNELIQGKHIHSNFLSEVSFSHSTTEFLTFKIWVIFLYMRSYFSLPGWTGSHILGYSNTKFQLYCIGIDSKYNYISIGRIMYVCGQDLVWGNLIQSARLPRLSAKWSVKHKPSMCDVQSWVNSSFAYLFGRNSVLVHGVKLFDFLDAILIVMRPFFDF